MSDWTGVGRSTWNFFHYLWIRRNMAAGILDPEFLIGASLADQRFKVVARVGAGSMAIVYRAYDHRLETEVVVKVPKKQKLEDPGLRERFRRESRLLVQLQHPHIVRILDVGVHGNVPFVVMQYLSGGCLLDRMQSRNGEPRAMPVDSIRTWLLEVAKALDFAHQQQVVHRDVKPANILFDEAGNAFLSDFGLTKMLYGEPREESADETAAGFVVGTPNFVAPEIVLGREYDGRADQYSLGISVYNVLVGKPPMLGKTPSATMVNQTRRELPLLSDVRPAVPEATARAIARAIRKNPEERFATCAEFAQAAISGLQKNGGGNKRAATTSDSTARSRADSTGSRRKSSEDIGPSSLLSAASPARSEQVLMSRARAPGIIDCPVCRRELRLQAQHGGRIGRCNQCATRMRIAEDLSTVRTILTSDASKSSSNSSDAVSSSAANSADDLILGEKVFGVKFGRKTIFAIGLVVVALLLVAVITLVLQLKEPETLKQKADEFRSLEN